MGKKENRKTVRFNNETVNIIEQRNVALYPTETSFIEKAIYQMQNPEIETDVLILKNETKAIRKMLQELQEAVKVILEKLEVENENHEDGVSELVL